MTASDSFIGAALVDSPYAEARAEIARLRKALRDYVLYGPMSNDEHFIVIGCAHCEREWDADEPESHAHGCLAAPTA